MEKRKGSKKNMSDETASLVRKIKRASKILFYQRHRQPGVKGWELKKTLGKDYLKVVKILNEQLENLDLQVRIIYEERNRQDIKWGEQHHTNLFWLGILIEEIGEIAKAILENGDIFEELIQSIAVCIAWIEDKDGNY